MDVDDLAAGIVAGVGGPTNIRSVGHCTTRLRLVLSDRTAADRESVRALPGVMSTVERGGQFQVVVGQHVGLVDTQVRSLVSAARDGAPVDEAPLDLSPVDRAFDLLTGTFHPLLWALVGSSMIKTFLALAVELGWISTTSTTYAIWAAAGNAAFYFLPVLVGITASLKLGANPYVGGAIAAALLHAEFTEIGPVGTEATFLGLPVVVIDYGQSVFPALIAAILLSIMERALRGWLPRSLHLILIPTICLAVLVPATAILFGPVGTYVSEALSAAIGWLWQLSPVIAGAIMGGLWQVFVIFGVHWGFVPVIVNDLSVQGYSLLTGPLVAAVLAQGAASLAVMFRTRNQEMRTLAGAASVSAFVAGVTEPAIYGVTLRLRKPFIYACIGGMVGGGIAAAGGSAANSFIFPGLITLPAYMHVGNFTLQLVGTATAVAITFVLTMVAGFQDVPATAPAETAGPAAAPDREPQGGAGTQPVPGQTATGSAESVTTPVTPEVPTGAAEPATLLVSAPLTGAVLPLSAVPDPVFARGLMGPGVAIRPTNGVVRSPVVGTVTSLARAGHAVGITSAEGVEVLIHVGIDTVHLGGRHFEGLVTRDQPVVVGSPLMLVDLDALTSAGYETATPVVVTNAATFASVDVLAADQVAAGDPLLRVTRGA
ncbi:MAG TPA: glucose PTS transporter subunit IIA [Candidatus Limnocylindrales bacterium]|nr:glucose PTS transporter subunit IIA [Candidatus Limnocylindrales bacterium]